MARFSGSSGRPGKRSRNVSETASLSSWGSEVNVLSDVEEAAYGAENPSKKRRSTDSTASPDPDKDFSSSDDDTQSLQQAGATRGKRPKCFSRNAVLARQNRLKKKKYMEDLENELQVLRRENSKLKVSLSGYTKDVELVRKENVYLRNVLANSKEISQLLRSININCALPTTTAVNSNLEAKRPAAPVTAPPPQSKVIVESVVPATSNVDSDSCVPSAPCPPQRVAARTVKKDFPIAVDDVSLSLSAPEDEPEDDLEVLFGSKAVPVDLDLNLNEAPLDDDYLGFGPNAFGDWLDGDEPLSNIGVCLHVAKKKVSLEFCSSCNENAMSSWNGITV